MDDSGWNKLGLICALVEKSDRAGRTALMKFAYLLKEIKGVPLGYRFRLHIYGPFDSRLLGDLGYAEALHAVKSSLEPFPGGYSYRYAPGDKIGELKERARDFLEKYNKEIDWVVGEFGSKDAGALEMISTIVFVDRSAEERKSKNSVDALSEKVFKIKPHLNLGVIRKEVERLNERGYLKAVAAG